MYANCLCKKEFGRNKEDSTKLAQTLADRYEILYYEIRSYKLYSHFLVFEG
jgi:hypothetical protein